MKPGILPVSIVVLAVILVATGNILSNNSEVLAVQSHVELDEDETYYPLTREISYPYSSERRQNVSLQEWGKSQCSETAVIELGSHLLPRLNLSQDTDVLGLTVSGGLDNRKFQINYRRSDQVSLDTVKQETPDIVHNWVYFRGHEFRCSITVSVETPSTYNTSTTTR